MTDAKNPAEHRTIEYEEIVTNLFDNLFALINRAEEELNITSLRNIINKPLTNFIERFEF